MKGRTRTAACALLAAAVPSMHAAAVEFDFSGFASAIVGKTSGSCTESALAPRFAETCTRFVADWGHAGVYSEDVSARPESKLGLQATARFTPQLSATGQVVARVLDKASLELEWAYLTFAPNASWTFQAGRKRVPLFFYSDFQDVGYAYPWVRVPPDVYGWDVVNYNGASATYNKTFGEWSLRSSVFGGAETSRKNKYSKLFYEEDKDVKWPGIAGADLELQKGWFTGRVVYMRSDYEQRDRATGELDAQPSGEVKGRHQAYGGSVNIDYENWLVRTEYSIFDRSRYAYKATSWFVSIGHRIGSFTPMLTASDYRESTRYPEAYETTSWRTRSFTLRYDFGKSSAVKLQLDKIRDRSASSLMGDATLWSASYDVVF